MTIETMSTVRDLAVTIPGATRIFEQMGIDYCCGGGNTLGDACQKLRIPAEEVIRQLQVTESALDPDDKAGGWQAKSLTDLSTHIVETHHVFTKQELTRLETLLDKVCSRHGENHPELSALSSAFLHLKQDLTPHMLKEEQILFPYIARMEQAVNEGKAVPPSFFVTVQNPVRMMMTEHDTAGELLSQMRVITGNYTIPPDACISFQTLYQALQELEADLHQHIHLENNLLFPRAIEMESIAEPDRQIPRQGASEHVCFGH